MRGLFVAVALIAGCRTDAAMPVATGPDAPAPDAFVGTKASPCASTFGHAITQAFGRLDGTIHAVIPPADRSCAMDNDTHLQIEVEANGAQYRMFVNVQSDQGPPDVYVHELDAPIVGAPWLEGWHPNLLFDYVAQLGLHGDVFVQTPTAALVTQISDELNLGDTISVYASSSSNNSDSAHLVHRNPTNHDGAIVLRPDSATPHWILIRFDEQTF